MMDVETATAIADQAHKRVMKITVVSFAVMIVAMFVAAIYMTLQFDWGLMMWAMVMMGAIIITILLSSLFVPYYKETRAK